MDEITLKGYAKINLTLDVTGRRENGYHDVKMLMQNIDLYDNVKVKLTDKGITIKSNAGYIPLNNKNIAYKAAELFFNETGIEKGCDIYIEKNIPVSAGLAGGSVNGACVLKALNTLTKANLSDEKLREMGLKIGADVPYCLSGKTALAEGLGEILTPVTPLKKAVICLAKPDYSVNTAQVYKDFDSLKNVMHPDTKGAIDAIDRGDIKELGKKLYNVLEEVTGKKYSVIGQIKGIMYDFGSIGAVMSGSGPTVFGFFENEKDALKASEEIKKLCSFVTVTTTL